MQFKLCVLNRLGQEVRWEHLQANRSFTPRSSLIVSFVDSEPALTCKPTRRPSYQSLVALKVRTGT